MAIKVQRTLAAALAAAVVLGGAQYSGAAADSGSTVRGTRTAAGPASGTTVEWPVTRCGTYSGTGCAPVSARVDVQRPKFSNPTRITNPLFPISALDSVVLLGKVDGLPFRS